MGNDEVEVAVVGGGHNGLIAAAYLARDGHEVAVFERDSVPGGAVSTVERFPGYRVDRGSSAHLMIRHTPIIDELELGRFGLRYLDCDPWAFAPATEDSPAIVFSVDLDATCAHIAAACGDADAHAYRRFVGVWAPRAQAMMRALTHPPTPPSLARAFWGLPDRRGRSGRTAAGTVSQEFLQSGDALLDSWFDDERLKAALAWFGAQSGPPMDQPGTAPMVGFAALMHRRPPGRAIGGSGALTSALISAITHHGGAVHTARAITGLTPTGDSGRATHRWVLTDSTGTTTRARTVIAACHVLTTFDLLEAGGLPASATKRWRREISVGNGIGMAVRIGARALPDYPGLPTDLPPHGVHSGLGLLVSERGHLAAAHGDALAGQLPRRPAVLSMGFSAIDPTLAPEGRHLLTLWSQWQPYRLSGGRSWHDLGSRAADDIISEFDRHAPGFADQIEHVHVQTPDDLHTELGLLGGNVMHVEMSLDQMFAWRPHPDLAGGHIPSLRGLTLAGASMHPGGGVNGASGRLAAAAAAHELCARRWMPRWSR
ncbi:phytoene desaturase family protein [Gordonia jinhuaensis]|nr:NAD(P)/FAD-dependent oxidoreductase [Gordonia jinhuaensis]